MITDGDHWMATDVTPTCLEHSVIMVNTSTGIANHTLLLLHNRGVHDATTP
jgi:hypothetical protein